MLFQLTMAFRKKEKFRDQKQNQGAMKSKTTKKIPEMQDDSSDDDDEMERNFALLSKTNAQWDAEKEQGLVAEEDGEDEPADGEDEDDDGDDSEEEKEVVEDDTGALSGEGEHDTADGERQGRGW